MTVHNFPNPVESDNVTSRIRVHGGWLYTTFSSSADEAGAASAFVPDIGLVGHRVRIRRGEHDDHMDTEATVMSVAMCSSPNAEQYNLLLQHDDGFLEQVWAHRCTVLPTGGGK